jgi:hypothetical protein
MSNRRKLGIAAKLNGKEVKWAGSDYGFQSPASFNKLKQQNKLPKPPSDKLGDALNAYLGHLGRDTIQRVRNLRAEAALRGNERSKADPKNIQVDKYGTITRRMSAGGLTTQGYSYPETFPDGSGDYNIHGINFNRETKDFTLYDARTDSRPEVNKVRQANIKYQLGDFLDAMQPDDVLESNVYNDDGKGRGRAGLYSRQTNGAVAPQLNTDGSWDESSITTQRADKTTWRSGNSNKTVKFNPNDLKKPLKNLAAGAIVKRLVQHPVAQAAVTVDEVIGGMTGKRPSATTIEAHRQMNTRSIEERLKKGERFINPNLRF